MVADGAAMVGPFTHRLGVLSAGHAVRRVEDCRLEAAGIERELRAVVSACSATAAGEVCTPLCGLLGGSMLCRGSLSASIVLMVFASRSTSELVLCDVLAPCSSHAALLGTDVDRSVGFHAAASRGRHDCAERYTAGWSPVGSTRGARWGPRQQKSRGPRTHAWGACRCECCAASRIMVPGILVSSTAAAAARVAFGVTFGIRVTVQGATLFNHVDKFATGYEPRCCPVRCRRSAPHCRKCFFLQR
jgi:hypothetical protein